MQRHLVRRLILLALVVAVFGAIGSTAQAATSDLVSGRLWWGLNRASTSEPGAQTVAAGGSPVSWLTPATDNQTPFGVVFDSALGKVFWIESDASSNVLVRAAGIEGASPATLVTLTGPSYPSYGLTYDPSTRTLYWIASDGVHYALWKSTVSADGTSANAPTVLYALDAIDIYGPQEPTVDPAAGRIYWTNTNPSCTVYTPFPSGDCGLGFKTAFYANLDGSSNPAALESINPTGGTCTPDPVFGYEADSIAIDHAAGKLYISGGDTTSPKVVQTDLNGTNCTTLLTVAHSSGEMRGLGIDPVAKRLYAASYEIDEIYYVDLATPSKNGVVTTTPATASIPYLSKPNSLFLATPPSGTAAVTPATGKTGTKLTCAATWGANEPSLFLARAANSTTYAWALDGKALPDTTAEITAAKAGTYTCTATGTNTIGSGTATATAKVTAKAKKKAAKTRLTIISGNVRGGTTLVVRVRASMAGTVRLTAKLDGAQACTASKKVGKGVATLLCPLSADAQATVATNATLFRLAGRLTTPKRQTANATGVVRAQPYAAQGVTG